MKRIYARNTTSETVSSDIADEFITQYHNQGLVTIGKGRYDVGLFYEGELVGLTTFANSRTKAKARQYQHELIRMTFKTDVRIVGGASKMIKYYIDDFKPRNFFTYQTTSGENSDVYLKSGMTLRSSGSDKRILVKNGYTYESAQAAFRETREKYLFLSSQLVNLGPDHILGTKIGTEMLDGSRKTNEMLFIEHCDYHVEMVPGDRVFDFNNDKYDHYIYKISSTNPDDGRYYIGRHSVYNPQGHTLDHLRDGYMGSGGDRFQIWKQEVLATQWYTQKEILSTQDTWLDNIKAEAKAIGDKYFSDKNCMNMSPGGLNAAVASVNIEFSEKECAKHGLTLFRNMSCGRCLYEKSINTNYCVVHGKTSFRGDHCLKCVSSKAIHMNDCPVHGETTFNGIQCMKCQNAEMHRVALCPSHGETLFKGDACAKCTAAKSIELKHCHVHGIAKHRSDICLACRILEDSKVVDKVCSVHGLSKHRGNSCLSCVAQSRHSIGVCEIHGETTFSGETCVQCTNQNAHHEALCAVHGRTTFQGDRCRKCVDDASRSVKHCEIHGLVNHHGDVCLTCKNQASINQKWCEACGKETRFNGETCMACVNKAMITVKTCPVHGESKHRGQTCSKCAGAKRKKKSKSVPVVERKLCLTCHKEARHVDGKCMPCKEQALYNTAVCETHGETKFRGKKCCMCHAEMMKLRRAEKKKNEITK